MTLYITRTFDPRTSTTFAWYIGNAVPSISSLFINTVIAVQADGDELDMIIRKFSFLPHIDRRRVMRWYGDHARFIVGNLK